MFSAAVSDEEVGKEFCRTMLSVLLQKVLGEIQITAQKTRLPCTPEMWGIRMDVEVKEPLEDKETLPSLNVYDVEPHLRKEKYFPKHNRFYQAKIDSRYIRSGDRDFGNLPNLFVLTITEYDPHLRKEKYFPKHNRFYQAKIDSRYIRSGDRDFGNLPNLFVLTITEYDPFGKDQMIYTVSNSCREEPGLKYDDGLVFYYFNTEGKKFVLTITEYDPFGKDQMIYTVSNSCREEPGLKYDDGLVFYYFNTEGKKSGTPEIQAMLKYMMESTEKNVVNEDIRNLHRCVERVKVLPEVREEFMRFEEWNG